MLAGTAQAHGNIEFRSYLFAGQADLPGSGMETGVAGGAGSCHLRAENVGQAANGFRTSPGRECRGRRYDQAGVLEANLAASSRLRSTTSVRVSA